MKDFRFRELDVCQKGLDLINALYDLSEHFLKEKIYCLASQLRRAAISINLNIAEGNGRHNPNEQKQFYYLSRGSFFEIVAVLDICRKREYIPETEYQAFIQTCSDIQAKLNGLIKYAKEQSASR